MKRGREWERELSNVELFASITRPHINLYLRQALALAGLRKTNKTYFWHKANIKRIFGIVQII